MELDHHRDRDETAGALPACLVSWIRRTSMDMGRMAGGLPVAGRGAFGAVPAPRWPSTATS